MGKSTRKQPARKAASVRPPKPYRDFELCPHPQGRWQKKIGGRLHYFGRWGRQVNGVMERLSEDGNWREALEEYKAFLRGETHNSKPDVVTVRDVCNAFRWAKLRAMEAGRLEPDTYKRHVATCNMVVRAFGKEKPVEQLRPADFEALLADMSKGWGPHRLANGVQNVRSVFRYAFEADLIDKPIKFGSEFKKPSASVIRRHRAQRGEQMLEPADIRAAMEQGDTATKAWILLGCNCGFYPKDCAKLPLNRVDLEKGWIVWPRTKTGIARSCPLWAETVQALRDYLAERPQPQPSAETLLFVSSKLRQELARSLIGRQVGKALQDAGVHREGLGMSTLRHVFETIADEARDPNATNLVMGHADNSMAGVYRERIDDDRLRAVVGHVRAWLFGTLSPRSPVGALLKGKAS